MINQINLENLYFYLPEVGALSVDCETDAGVTRIAMNATRHASRTFIPKFLKKFIHKSLFFCKLFHRNKCQRHKLNYCSLQSASPCNLIKFRSKNTSYYRFLLIRYIQLLFDIIYLHIFNIWIFYLYSYIYIYIYSPVHAYGLGKAPVSSQGSIKLSEICPKTIRHKMIVFCQCCKLT